MSRRCSWCSNLDTSDMKEYSDGSIAYWCDKYHSYVEPDDCTCYDYDDAERDDDEIDEINNGEIPNTGCYLTTATCDILGMPRDNIFLNTLREAREKYGRNCEENYRYLAEYDIVGPEIARRMYNDKKKKEIALNVLKELAFILQDLYANNVEIAKRRYLNLTENLRIYYKVEKAEINNDLIKKLDIKKSGTGKLIKKENED